MSAVAEAKAPEPVHNSAVKRRLGDIHVATPLLEAIRRVMEQLPKGRDGFFAMDRKARRYFIACVIKHHRRNQYDYRYVMGSVPREYPAFNERYYFNYETKEVFIND